MITRSLAFRRQFLRTVTWCFVAVAVGVEFVAAGEIPTVEDLGKLLAGRSEKLDGIDVTYIFDDEFLFDVPGVTKGRRKDTGTNGRYRTVCLGRKRRFETYLEGKYIPEIIIFDGETTAQVNVKRSQPGRGVTAFLKRGMTNQAAIDCDYCFQAFRKPLSDVFQAKAYAKEIFPWNLALANDPASNYVIQVDAQLQKINDSSCIVVRYWGGLESYWLDMDRGFTLVRGERFVPLTRDLDGPRVLHYRSTASDFRQHGEYWVPYRYEREHGAPAHLKERAGEIYYRVKITVEKISIGEVTDDDFRIEMRDGADIFDADHGHLIVNKTSRLAEVGDLVAELQASRRNRWWAWSGVVAAVIALAAAWWWRRRATASKATAG